MNVLIVMAGPSAAFKEAGYIYPKGLIELDGSPIVRLVVENYASLQKLGARFIFALRMEDARKYRLGAVIRLLMPEAKIIEVERDTSGGACTALLAVEYIDNDEPLVIANGDQLIQEDLGAIVNNFVQSDFDGGIVTFDAVHPRWSYVRIDDKGYVTETSEKNPISRHATAGFYYFKRGRDFVAAAKELILKDAQVDGVFYVCPCYNEMILKGARIGVHEISSKSYLSLANPQSVQLAAERLGATRTA